MITELNLGYQVESDGFIFTLGSICISVESLDGDLVAYLPVLNDNGHRIVRTLEQLEIEIAFWLKDHSGR